MLPSAELITAAANVAQGSFAHQRLAIENLVSLALAITGATVIGQRTVKQSFEEVGKFGRQRPLCCFVCVLNKFWLEVFTSLIDPVKSRSACLIHFVLTKAKCSASRL